MRTVFCSALLFLVGCGDSGIGVKLSPVTGIVTKAGSPLGNVKVMLESPDPASKAPLILGITDAEGKYSVQTSAGEKGAPLGLYKVYLVPPVLDAQFDYAQTGTGGPKKDELLIPERMQSPKTTELSVEVTTTGAVFDIKIP